jgi:hypothetical protein
MDKFSDFYNALTRHSGDYGSFFPNPVEILTDDGRVVTVKGRTRHPWAIAFACSSADKYSLYHIPTRVKLMEHHSAYSLAWLCDALESMPENWILIETEEQLREAVRRLWPDIKSLILSTQCGETNEETR